MKRWAAFLGFSLLFLQIAFIFVPRVAAADATGPAGESYNWKNNKTITGSGGKFFQSADFVYVTAGNQAFTETDVYINFDETNPNAGNCAMALQMIIQSVWATAGTYSVHTYNTPNTKRT